MGDSFIQEMQIRLNAMRAEIDSVSATGKASSEIVELDQSKVGRLSRMDAMQAQAMSQASVRRREQTLRLVDLALKRIASDVYGTCRSCEEDIDRKRLEIDPTVLLCIDCANEKDQRDRQ